MNNKIKELREANKLTQEELARKVGITRPYLSDLERNKKKPGMNIALKISKALKVQLDDIFFEDNVHHGVQTKTA